MSLVVRRSIQLELIFEIYLQLLLRLDLVTSERLKLKSVLLHLPWVLYRPKSRDGLVKRLLAALVVEQRPSESVIKGRFLPLIGINVI